MMTIDILRQIGIQQWRVRGRCVANETLPERGQVEQAEAAPELNHIQPAGFEPESESRNRLLESVQTASDTLSQSVSPSSSSLTRTEDLKNTENLSYTENSNSYEESVSAESDQAQLDDSTHSPSPKQGAEQDGSMASVNNKSADDGKTGQRPNESTPTQHSSDVRMPSLRPAPIPLELEPSIDLTLGEPPSEAHEEANCASAPMPAPLINYSDADIPPVLADDDELLSVPIDSTPTPIAEAIDLGSLAELDWRALQRYINDDQYCPSCGQGRSTLGYGDALADWMFVADAPTSADLEAQQLHTQRAGQLFRAILLACGLSQESVYSTTVFKCVPPDDLSMSPQCDKLIHRQLALVQPKVIVTMGEFATQTILRENQDFDALFGSIHQLELRGVAGHAAVIPIPALTQLLAEPLLKKQVWACLKKQIQLLQE